MLNPPGSIGNVGGGQPPDARVRSEEEMTGLLPRDFVEGFLGNGGSPDLAVDGSVTPVVFAYVPTVDEIISRCNIYIQDANPTPMKFGGITGPLTNGIIIRVRDTEGTVIKTFLEGSPIVDNAGFTSLAGVDVSYDTASGVDNVSIRWTLGKHSGGPPLFLKAGFSFEVIVQDDLSPIELFSWALQGRVP